MSAVLTIIGGSARAAAQSAARSGFVVHAADLFADTDLRAVAASRAVQDYPDGLLETLRGGQPGSWLYTGALENHPDQIEHGQRLRPLLGNSAEVVRGVRDPELVAAALQAAGVAVPEVRRTADRLPRDGSWLIKPRRSAGGARIALLETQESVDTPAEAERYYQRRVYGTSVSAVFLATRREVALLGITEQLGEPAWGGDSPFRYCGSIGPRDFGARVATQFQRIGAVLHATFGLQGLYGVDAILSEETVWPVEVNPRFTASIEIIERATGFKAIAAHVAACERSVLTTPHAATRLSGKLIVWAQNTCIFPTHDALPAEFLSVGPEAALADVPSAGGVIQVGWPIATVLADANSPQAVADTLRRRAAALRLACRAAQP